MAAAVLLPGQHQHAWSGADVLYSSRLYPSNVFAQCPLDQDEKSPPPAPGRPRPPDAKQSRARTVPSLLQKQRQRRAPGAEQQSRELLRGGHWTGGGAYHRLAASAVLEAP
jgi:hypothetical protein